jgi:hypothetical protein
MKNKTKTQLPKMLLFAVSATFLLGFNACGKKQNENEMITNVKLTFSQSGSTKGSFEWKDPDGDGGNNPLLPDTIKLDSGQTYDVNIEFFDQSSGTVKNLTEEVKEEGKDHFICFTSAPAIAVVSYADSDGKHPIGLTTQWKIAMRSNGKMRIVLRHQPGVKDGTCDPGESDVDIEFPMIAN